MKCVETVSFDIREFFEISESEVSRIDCFEKKQVWGSQSDQGLHCLHYSNLSDWLHVKCIMQLSVYSPICIKQAPEG